jgi:predicted  nucleic acid-binding Zn-ribbon protein
MAKERENDREVRQIDFEEVEKLVHALERDLEKIRGSSADIQRVRDEVETLKNVLKSPVRRHHWVRDALHDIREGIVAEGAEVSRYVAEIGRILGL